LFVYNDSFPNDDSNDENSEEDSTQIEASDLLEGTDDIEEDELPKTKKLQKKEIQMWQVFCLKSHKQHIFV